MEDVAAAPFPATPADSASGFLEDRRSSSHRPSRIGSLSRSPSFSSSTVPFSWEQRPGIPKPLSPASDDASVPHLLLPLPPPVRSHSDLIPTPRKKRSASAAARRAAVASADPFADALALCAKRALPSTDDDELREVHEAAASARRSAAAVADRLRIMDLYGSCKATCAVVDATVRLPRPGSLRLPSRRP